MTREDPKELMDAVVRLRGRALTPAQLGRRAEVAWKASVISAGVRAPKSGVFGKPASKKEKES